MQKAGFNVDYINVFPETAERIRKNLKVNYEYLVGNFRLFGNPSDCVHEPIPVEDSNNSFIFEIEVKGPRKLVLAENQMYPA